MEGSELGPLQFEEQCLFWTSFKLTGEVLLDRWISLCEEVLLLLLLRETQPFYLTGRPVEQQTLICSPLSWCLHKDALVEEELLPGSLVSIKDVCSPVRPTEGQKQRASVLAPSPEVRNSHTGQPTAHMRSRPDLQEEPPAPRQHTGRPSLRGEAPPTFRAGNRSRG